MSQNNNILKMSTKDFSQFLKEQNIHRFFFVYDFESKKVSPSHTVLQPIAEMLMADKRDFDEHEGLFFELDDQTDTILGATVHNTRRGQAAGGVRYWHYGSIEEYIRDGLRLAQGMTRKNALAGLWWGGGKGVMAQDPEVDVAEPKNRARIYRKYGEFMTSLNGCYVTAEDVGTSVEDMAEIFFNTRFTTCIPFDKGGSGNPSIPTAKGVVSGIEAALEFLKLGDFSDKTVAVMGAGHVGAPLIRFLFEKGVKKVKAFDISKENIDNLIAENSRMPLEAKVILPGDDTIFSTQCDIFAPCATGAILNPKTIPLLKAKIICGAANNQLEDADRDGPALVARNILYVPDFLTNRMGIVNCANEQYGFVDNDEMIERHFDKDWEYSIYQTALRVFEDAQKNNQSPAHIANIHADEMARVLHPVFGHRGYKIIASLMQSDWAK